MSVMVIVHGAWHDGSLFEPTAKPLRANGHDVHLPTLAGNNPGDDKQVGLTEAIDSLCAYIDDNELTDFVLVGHSYGGMVITGTADRLGDRIQRLVYWNAFVPNDGESLNDMVPPHYVAMFDSLTADDGSVALPFEIWREAFINDAPLELAESAYAQLNPHPLKTFSEPISLTRNPSDFDTPKSYINCMEDTAMPHSLPWHPRLSEKLGLFRLVQIPGSHELCFSSPERLAAAIETAARP